MSDSRRALLISRLKLVLLALCFLGPLVVAWVWYANVDQWRPAGAGGGSHGELFDPPRPLSDVRLQATDGAVLDEAYFQGQWTMVYAGGAECDEVCESRLYFSRQIRTALGRDMQRVQRLYALVELPDAGTLEARIEGHPDLTVARIAEDGSLLESFRHADEDPLDARRIYIVDPLGNVIMSFSPEVDPRDLRDDLKHLLRVSRIG